MNFSHFAAGTLLILFLECATAQPVEPVLAQARAHSGPLLGALKELAARLIMDLARDRIR